MAQAKVSAMTRHVNLIGTQPTPAENIERAAEIREVLRGLVA